MTLPADNFSDAISIFKATHIGRRMNVTQFSVAPEEKFSCASIVNVRFGAKNISFRFFLPSANSNELVRFVLVNMSLYRSQICSVRNVAVKTSKFSVSHNLEILLRPFDDFIFYLLLLLFSVAAVLAVFDSAIDVIFSRMTFPYMEIKRLYSVCALRFETALTGAAIPVPK